jgi:hypothetical protein
VTEIEPRESALKSHSWLTPWIVYCSSGNDDVPVVAPVVIAAIAVETVGKPTAIAIAGDHILVQGRLVQGKQGQGKVEMKPPLTTGDCVELRRGQFEELPKSVFHYRNSSLWFRPIALPAVVGPQPHVYKGAACITWLTFLFKSGSDLAK